MTDIKKIELRSYLIFLLFIVLAGIIIFKILKLQFIESDKYDNFEQKNNIKTESYYSRRGNIYSSEGYLLSTSVSKYDIRLDLVAIKEKLFKKEIKPLSDSLSRMFRKYSKKNWGKILKELRYKKKSKYYLLAKKISYKDYIRLKKFPVFNKGRYKGGFIAEQRLERGLPLKGVASRFIGYEDYRGKAGLEGAYSVYLKGRKGERVMQKIINGEWKPLNTEKNPKEGADILTTININFQNRAHNILKKQLQKFEANHGCVVVMEVETGKIKAISNLYRDKNDNIYEKRNYSVFEAVEPGSTFKLMSVLAMLEGRKADRGTIVNIENGRYKIYNRIIMDVERTNDNQITLEKAFEMSSNVGISKLVYENYKNKPSEFINRLYSMGLGKKIGLEIKGEGIPRIPSPKDSRWSGVSLAWISYGYEVLMTPIQILTFYNAVANNGKMIKPMFVSKIIDRDQITDIEPVVLKESIATKKNIKVVQELLRNVVLKGTARSIKDDYFKFAGKTGTAQQGYWRGKDNIEYISSFVGYFPADKPKYSCIVVINNPNKSKGYYGSTVALPVFNELGKYIYTTITENENLENKSINTQKLVKKSIKLEKGIMPNLIGLPAYKAISIAENLGLKVKIEGSGKVKKQTIDRGTKIFKNQIIGLILNE